MTSMMSKASTGGIPAGAGSPTLAHAYVRSKTVPLRRPFPNRAPLTINRLQSPPLLRSEHAGRTDPVSRLTLSKERHRHHRCRLATRCCCFSLSEHERGRFWCTPDVTHPSGRPLVFTELSTR
ncbi:hypothetical protein LSAT2_019750 [Lamellibrachia satsuma]|nr:hypothetical protein LSAT2_019750 [Lamellibrachia satsuma]